MSLLSTYPGLLQALSHEMTPKFLASRSADGFPNVVPVTSLMPAGDVEDRLIFGNFLLHKSVRNLDADPRVGILVITTDLEGWVLHGDFLGGSGRARTSTASTAPTSCATTPTPAFGTPVSSRCVRS